jgi:uncharacterized protein
MSQTNVLLMTESWLSGFVIKLGLCPFAAIPYQKGKIRITVYEEEYDQNQLSKKILEEARRLIAYTDDQLETTLVVIPVGLEDFMDYLEMTDLIESLFIKQGYEGVLQIATFHPHYRFADSLPDDPADYTNRSPFPMFHLLRENSISQAVDNYPDIENIPERNKILLRRMGKDDIYHWLEKLYNKPNL